MWSICRNPEAKSISAFVVKPSDKANTARDNTARTEDLISNMFACRLPTKCLTNGAKLNNYDAL